MEVARVTEEHIQYLAENLREGDRNEAEAATGKDPLEVVRDMVERSVEAAALLIDGNLLTIFGHLPAASPLYERWGRLWNLTTHHVEKHPKAFHRFAKQVVESVGTRYDALVSHVDARYDTAVRWTARLGYEVEGIDLGGPENRPFLRFVRR